MTIELLVERDQLKKRIEELEETVAKQDDHLRQACDEVTRCHARIHELVDELAPVRALKVGSWRWAMVQHALNPYRPVIDRFGERVGGMVINSSGEPFTLYTPPEPEPTAAELAEAIRNISDAWVKDRNMPSAITNANVLAARVKRKEAHDGKKD